MAVIKEFSEEERVVWEQWVASRPPTVRAVAEHFPPNRLYRLRETGQRVTIAAYIEMGDGVERKRRVIQRGLRG